MVKLFVKYVFVKFFCLFFGKVVVRSCKVFVFESSIECIMFVEVLYGLVKCCVKICESFCKRLVK